MPIYILVDDIRDMLRKKNVVSNITAKILKSNAPGLLSNNVYETLQEANIGLKESPSALRTAAIVELNAEISKTDLMSLRTNNGSVVPSQLIKSVHFGEVVVPANDLDSATREKEHITSLNYDALNQEKLKLDKPPLIYLRQLQNQLRFLLFIDHKLFDYHIENLRQYNAREPGCGGDLFKAAVTTCKLILSNSGSGRSVPITLDLVKEFQRILSQSVFQSSDNRSGNFRQGYTGFPLVGDAVTKEGIRELVARIKLDNNPEGFKIGKLVKLKIVSTCCEEISIKLYSMLKITQENPENTLQNKDQNIKLKSDLVDKQLILTIQQTAISKMVTEYTRKGIDISEDKIIKIMDHYFKSINLSTMIDELVGESLFIHKLASFFSEQSMQYDNNTTKAEYQVEMEYARAHPIIDCSTPDQHLEQLTEELFGLISNDDISIHLLTPEPNIALKWAQMAIDKYNHDILTASTMDDVIKTIDGLTHELEILHIFDDVNCRTNYFLQNTLLLLNGLKWSILYNPNRLDANANFQRIEEIKIGIFRTDYIMANQGIYTEKNNRIDKAFQNSLMVLNSTMRKTGASGRLMSRNAPLASLPMDSFYSDISNELQKNLDNYVELFQERINGIRKVMDEYKRLQSFSEQTLYNLPQDNTIIAKIYNELSTLEKTYDTHQFFNKITDLVKQAHLPKEFNDLLVRNIDVMKELAGFKVLQSDCQVSKSMGII